MRIAMFLDTDFPPDSRVENEAVSLIGEGHEVVLFSLSYKSVVHAAENIRGIKVYRTPGSKLLYKLSALVYSLPFYTNIVSTKVNKFITEVKPDALHVHDMPIAAAVYKANKIFKLPVTLDLHEDRPEIMRFYPHMKKMSSKILISINQWKQKQLELMRKADNIILVTNEAKTKYSNIDRSLKEKIKVVPNTIVKDIFYQYPLDEQILSKFLGKKLVLYVGDTGLRRGTDVAIKAMPKVLKAMPEALLVIVGKSSEDGMLKSLVQELAIEKNVVFEGWQDVSLFPSYIKAATVCISPLKRNPHHDTTYANKIFQYMAMGKPQVVSNCPAQQHVIESENCGLVFTSENEIELAEKIVYLLKNKNIAEQMGGNAKEAVLTKWNWDITKKELMNIYA